jgi:hypothetical protein
MVVASPSRAVARVNVPLTNQTSINDFLAGIEPIKRKSPEREK